MPACDVTVAKKGGVKYNVLVTKSQLTVLHIHCKVLALRLSGLALYSMYIPISDDCVTLHGHIKGPPGISYGIEALLAGTSYRRQTIDLKATIHDSCQIRT